MNRFIVLIYKGPLRWQLPYWEGLLFASMRAFSLTSGIALLVTMSGVIFSLPNASSSAAVAASVYGSLGGQAAISGGQSKVVFTRWGKNDLAVKRFFDLDDFETEVRNTQRFRDCPYILAPINFDAMRREIFYPKAGDGDLFRFRGLKRISYANMVLIVAKVVSAVAALHQKGYLHMDIKPENIVRDGLNVWLIDLGLSTPLEGAARQIGTPRTMAPEVLFDADDNKLEWMPISEASDCWSLGVTIFYIFARYFDLDPLCHFDYFPYRVLYNDEGDAVTLEWPSMRSWALPLPLYDLLFGRRGLLSYDYRRRPSNAQQIMYHMFFKYY